MHAADDDAATCFSLRDPVTPNFMMKGVDSWHYAPHYAPLTYLLTLVHATDDDDANRLFSRQTWVNLFLLSYDASFHRLDAFPVS